MRCNRCNTALDDGAMVCSQCGAVVGMRYGARPDPAKFGHAPTPAPTQTFAPPLAGAARRLPERVRRILFSPRSEWEAIAREPTSAMDVWSGYVIPLALIGPIALMIAQVWLGTSYPMVGVIKATLVTGIATALLVFAFSLVQVAVLAWGVNAMAARFSGKPDRLAALKVIAYSMTPVWLVGLAYLVPVLQILWIVATVYAFLLGLIGLAELMRCPPPKALAYALTTLAIAFSLWIVTGVLVTAIMGIGPVMME